MLQFQPVKLSDKTLLQPLLYQNPYLLCNWSFSNMILWNDAFKPHYTFIDDMLILANLKDENTPMFNFPIGNGNAQPAIDKLITASKQNNYTFKMVYLTVEMKEMLEAMYPNQFEFEERRENFDYIYNVEDLLHLKGKKYQAKRNHINQFKKSYNYTYSPLRYEDVDECLAMHEMWKAENDHSLENCLLEQESCAVEIALKIFPYLDLKGGVLRVDNKTVAFTIGQALNDKIFDVQIEKGLKAYHGVYPTINQLFVEHEMQSFQYVNREEDVNDPGLRQSKLSYHPSILLKKYFATLK